MQERDEAMTRSNEAFLEGLYAFADHLLREILDQRCDPEERFYLPGLPVTNRELLGTLGNTTRPAAASAPVRSMWDGLMLTPLTENLYESAPLLLRLRWLYQLDEVWMLALVLAFVRRSDPKYEKSIAILQGDSGRSGVDVFLVKAIAEYLGLETGGCIPKLTADSRAKSDLFEIREDTQLILRKNVFLWLCGHRERDGRRRGGVTLYRTPAEASVIWVQETERISAAARRQLESGGEEQMVLAVQGRPGAGKKFFCRDVAGRLGYGLCAIHLSEILEESRQEGENLLCGAFFACRMNSCIPFLDLTNCKNESVEVLHLVENIVQEYALIFIGTTSDQTITRHLACVTQELSLDRLSMKDSLAMWQRIGNRYLVAEDVNYEHLAGKYNLLPGTICEVFARAQRRCWENGADEISLSGLLASIRACNQRSDHTLMERINATFRWEDLRVKPETLHSMQLACAHLKHRFTAQEYFGQRYPYGRGISVLMYGPPGTGKTMAAQVMANELQMDLCRIDLSQVSSKYIGETEKNLERIFREADQSNVILFFDEADSLFGKRTEVKDSNDKYANQETSYILQRIESYDGMVILATNFARNFDPAFMRRITVSIQFDLPDEKTRMLLWQDMLQSTPLAGNETILQNLAAQFELTGSNIKSIVRNAVFLALMEEHPLHISDVARAIKLEYEKMGKIANASNFGSFSIYIH